MVFLTIVQPNGAFDRRVACDENLGLVLLKCDYRSNFRNFDLERLRTFTPMVPKVSLQDFLPILGAPAQKLLIGLFDDVPARLA